ncbi:hypothetical protein H2201_006438 [Coniosporium apollinis]|uniref:Uncharacterized protein n=1 Tax=Coniosporium apollinis TaxID=61459 RepID=A0ABQ9NMM7_9PEZI|nr:hypothetical protein H2201_006438 [Coniosporium apollinis]
MKFSLPILALALAASACANDTVSHSHDSVSATSITTHTSTRTIMRVVTETHTGVPPTSAANVRAESSVYVASTGILPASGNATVPTGTGFKATAAPTQSAKPFTGAGNALRGVSAGALAIVGGVAAFVL